MMLHPALPNHGIEQKKPGKPLFVDSHDWAFTPTPGPQFWQATARNNESKDVPLFNLELAKRNKIPLFQA